MPQIPRSATCLLSRWKLLRHAMDCAESKDQIAAIDADNFSSRKKLGQRIERDSMIWVVEDWHQHGLVRDVEVCVTRRQSLTLEKHWRRHRQRLDSQGL